jgi:hypothetical protein
MAAHKITFVLEGGFKRALLPVGVGENASLDCRLGTASRRCSTWTAPQPPGRGEGQNRSYTGTILPSTVLQVPHSPRPVGSIHLGAAKHLLASRGRSSREGHPNKFEPCPNLLHVPNVGEAPVVSSHGKSISGGLLQQLTAGLAS